MKKVFNSCAAAVLAAAFLSATASCTNQTHLVLPDAERQEAEKSFVLALCMDVAIRQFALDVLLHRMPSETDTQKEARKIVRTCEKEAGYKFSDSEGLTIRLHKK